MIFILCEDSASLLASPLALCINWILSLKNLMDMNSVILQVKKGKGKETLFNEGNMCSRNSETDKLVAVGAHFIPLPLSVLRFMGI